MDAECHNQQEQQQVLLDPSSCSKLSTSSNSLDDLFSAQNTEVDVGMEWLSVFVEDCFSSPQSCVMVGPTGSVVHATTNTSKPSSSSSTATTTLKNRKQNNEPSSLQKNFASVPGKARSKRKRLSAAAPRTNLKRPLSIWSHNEPFVSDPPLLKQAYWLADSELINVPPKKKKDDDEEEEEVKKKKRMMMMMMIPFENENENDDEEMVVVTRRCTHCLSQRTPQWRAGPLGPKTLCNACGVRFKSGRLLPEYRPAKSPTFVSYLHSNSHKKVLEMRNLGAGAAAGGGGGGSGDGSVLGS